MALFLGMLIGLNRESMKRVAGIKTNAVVCLAAALVMMTAQYMESQFPGRTDMARLAAQVISGVGFLGVGTIIVSGGKVRGLTTAASLWTCACIGLAVGIGFIDGAVLVTFCLLLIFWTFPRIEAFIRSKSHYITLYVELEDAATMADLTQRLSDSGIKVEEADYVKAAAKKEPRLVMLTLKLPYPAEKFSLDVISCQEGVVRVISA